MKSATTFKIFEITYPHSVPTNKWARQFTQPESESEQNAFKQAVDLLECIRQESKKLI